MVSIFHVHWVVHKFVASFESVDILALQTMWVGGRKTIVLYVFVRVLTALWSIQLYI